MSLTADILFNSPPPLFTGTERLHLTDGRSIMQGCSTEARKKHDKLVKYKNESAIIKSIADGHNTINALEKVLPISRTSIQKYLLILYAKNKIIRHETIRKRHLFELPK